MSEKINDGVRALHHLQVDEEGDLWIHLDAGPGEPKASINITMQTLSRNERRDSVIMRGIDAVATMLRARGGGNG